MARRRRRQVHAATGGTDSLLDIVMNVVGVSFFILVYVFLEASGAVHVERLPIAHQGGTKPVMFEVAGSRLHRIETDPLDERLKEELKAFRTSPESLPDFLRRLERGAISNGTHHVSLRILGGRVVGLVYTLEEDAPGETVAGLMAKGSRFRALLAELDPDEHHLFFLVREDSFPVFREARAAALASGFGSGWTPMEVDKPIVFGLGGGGRSSTSANTVQF